LLGSDAPDTATLRRIDTVVEHIEEGVAETKALLDRFNEVSFEPVTTSALRIDVELQADVSGGALEWTVR